MSEDIAHKGIIERMEGDTCFVRIVQQSACAGCHARSMCSASESKEKVIEVTNCHVQFLPNEEVIVCGRTSLGLQAVWLAFVLPLLLVIIGIAIALNVFHLEETTGGLVGLALLVPYYFILYALRSKLKKRFIFTLKKYHPNTL